MILDELKQLPELGHVGVALVEFASSLFPGTKFEASDHQRFVSSPNNFVTFAVHHQRSRNITITLRGNPFEFAQFPELPLSADQNGYSTCKLTEVGQVAAAMFYVRRAAEVFRLGRTREMKRQLIIEQVPE